MARQAKTADKEAELIIASLSRASDAAVELSMESVHTQLYRAPEMLRRMRFDWACDAWSFACLLEVLWTHLPVYGDRAKTIALHRDSGSLELNHLLSKCKSRTRPFINDAILASCCVCARERMRVREREGWRP